MKNISKIFFLVVILITIYPWNIQSAYAANVLYVSPNGNDTNACLSPQSSCATIDGAISKASPGDTVYLQEGIYSDSLDPASTNVVTVFKDLNILGGWNSSFDTQTGLSMIDGEGKRTVLRINEDVTFYGENLSIQNGFTYSAGGIYNRGFSTFMNVVIHHNDGLNGWGGGVNNTGNLQIINSAIASNAASSAAGIANYGDLVIVNSTISDNVAENVGGGLSGGNSGTDTAALYNVTITNNTASTGAGVYYLYDGLTIQNTIIAGNINDSEYGYGKECYGSIESLGYNLIGILNGCSYEDDSGDLLEVEPLLGNLIHSHQTIIPYHPLLTSSPAIDSGNPSGCKDHIGESIIFDQRGVVRDGSCDIGAYEYMPPNPTEYIYAYKGSQQLSNVMNLFQEPLSAVVVDSIGGPVEGISVTFLAPEVGAGGVFTSTGTISETIYSNESGIAKSSGFLANEIAGSYHVSATILAENGPISTDYVLTNIGHVYLPVCFINHCPDFFDDFSQVTSGWPRFDNEYGRADYLDGEYSFQLKYPGLIYMLRSPSCERENYKVGVDAHWNGTPGISYGLIFGLAEDFSEYYLLYINPEYQTYKFYMYYGGLYYSGDTEYSSAIRPMNEINRIEVVHKGLDVDLFVNGTPLLGYYGLRIEKGYVGIVSATYTNQSFADARFDNFSFEQLNNPLVQNSLTGSGDQKTDLSNLNDASMPFENLLYWEK